MAFEEIIFPTKLSFGTSGGPGHRTHIISLDSGGEERVSRFSTSRRRYIGVANTRTREDFDSLQKFVIAVRGAAIGFRFEDPNDSTTAANGRSDPAQDDQIIGVGDGSTTIFQMSKTYEFGSLSRVRTLQKIQSGTEIIELDSVLQVETTDYTINNNTGEIIFNTAPPASKVVKGGCKFHVPVRFGENIDEVLAINLEAFDVASLPSIEMVEIIDGLESNEEIHPGGGQALTLNSDITISPTDGKIQRITPISASRTIRITVASNMPIGGPHFIFENVAGSGFSYNIEDKVELGIATVVDGAILSLIVGLDNSGFHEWKAF